MIATNKPALITLASAACAWSTFAQTLLFSDNFSGTDAWEGGTVSNEQCVLSKAFGAMNTNNPLATWVGSSHTVPTSGPLADNQTLEFRVDLVGANQEDLAAGLHYFNGWAEGYVFGKSQDTVGLFKFFDGGPAMAFFFWTNCPLKNQNVVLVLALTRRDSSLEINTRILDKDNANAVLFDRTVTDTRQADTVLPDRAAGGMPGTSDRVGTPWPIVQAPVKVVLGMTWLNPTRAPQPPAEIIFDNVEVWQYEVPQLAIQNAVVLSWPLTQGQFVLYTATNVAGPWTLVPDPWWRTNAGQNELSILAPDSQRFFRLHFMP